MYNLTELTINYIREVYRITKLENNELIDTINKLLEDVQTKYRLDKDSIEPKELKNIDEIKVRNMSLLKHTEMLRMDIEALCSTLMELKLK